MQARQLDFRGGGSGDRPVASGGAPFHISPEQWAFDIYDTATEAMSSNYVTVTGGRCEYSSTPFRYVWPSELDLMARLAGMTLRDRWGGLGETRSAR